MVRAKLRAKLRGTWSGFGIPLLPNYNASIGAAWLERGGQYIEANLRGGGEFGPAWERAGRGALGRLKVYEDLEAVRGARGARRFRAFVAEVPLTDMRHYHTWLAGHSWLEEYGDPEQKWEELRQISAYHLAQELQARESEEICSNTVLSDDLRDPFAAVTDLGDPRALRVLFTTSTRDDRVHPCHARKMVKLLQSLQLPNLQTFLYESQEGGHGGAASIGERALLRTLEYEFLHFGSAMGVDSDLGGEAQPATSSSEHVRRADAEETGLTRHVSVQCVQECIKKLHILPLKEADARIKGKSRMEVLADTLRQIRNTKEVVRSGDLVKATEAEFVVIKPAPELRGTWTFLQDFFVDGAPVICFQKIQFSAWGPTELSSEQLFNEYVRPYFKGEYAPYGPNAKRVRLLYTGQVVKLDNDIYLQVEATEPTGLGLVSTDTEIFANWDSTPEFEKVHILPFMERWVFHRRAAQSAAMLSVGRVKYELFSDYLKPYLVANPCKKYQANDFFTYQGVQFKVVACEPDTLARIGKSTTIFCEQLDKCGAAAAGSADAFAQL
eukprot:g2350.t1